MTDYVTVAIPEALLQRAKRLARVRQQPVEAVIADVLNDALPPIAESPVSITAEDVAVAREMEAYLSLHPTLKAEHFGQYVAILDGQLIDYDSDPAALYARVADRHSERFVWISPVQEEPLTTLLFRSPRVVDRL